MGFRRRHIVLLPAALCLVLGLALAGVGPVIPTMPDYEPRVPAGKDKAAEFIATDWPDFEDTMSLPSEYIKALRAADIDAYAFDDADGVCKKLDLYALGQAQIDPKAKRPTTLILVKMDAVKDAYGTAYPVKSPDLEGKTMKEVGGILRDTKHLEYMLFGPITYSA